MDSGTSIGFTGDVAFSGYFQDAWKDDGLLDGQIVSFLSAGNHVVVNLEGALTAQTASDRA